MSMACAGIHFGNTNSVISVLKNGKLETVSNETGDRVTPTMVAYTGCEKVIGLPAKQYKVRNPNSCVSNIKACIGQSFSDEHIEQVKGRCSCKVTNEHGTISFKVNVEDTFVTLSAVDAASFIFTKLLEEAEKIGGSDLEDLVLAVPKWFSEEQRIALCEASEKIGFNVLRIISEPAAALLAYGVGQEDPTLHCNVLVYRLGGCSMDASIVQVNSGMYRVVAEKRDLHFGGINFDTNLMKTCCEEFRRKYKLDPTESKRAIGKMMTAVESCKHGLSQMNTTAIALDSFYEGIDYHSQVSRSKFESTCSSHFQTCIKLVQELLSENSMNPVDIDKVILIGGGTRMPKLQQMFRDMFSESEFLTSIPPDEVVATGCALQAGLLQGRDDINLDSTTSSLDCVARNIGIEVQENGETRFDVIIPKNTPVPARRSRTFEVQPDQTSVVLRLHESSSNLLDESKLLGKVVIRDLLADKAKELVSDFELTRNGHLLVSLTDKLSQKKEQISIPILAV